MAGRIDENVFWPGINPDILKTRGSCMTCIREASSQPAGFPVAHPSPDYPFQMLVADYFSLHGHNFLVKADRFMGWNAIMSTPPGKFDGRNLCLLPTQEQQGRDGREVLQEDAPGLRLQVGQY